MMKISVIGDGGWGTAIAMVLHGKGINTTLWSVSREYASFLSSRRENVKFLKGVKLPDGLQITSDDKKAAEADMAIFVVPCEYLRSVAERFSGSGFRLVVSATKGIEKRSLKRPSEILSEYFHPEGICVLSGPSISFEVAKGMPTTVVVASSGKNAPEVRDSLATERFRVYTSDDIIGVELGGALKNVIAIAAGISDGMGFGTNSKAALLTRGLAEMTRLGVKMGARKETFSGLSGVGDLATTCISQQSRNRWFGEEIGKGRRMEEILAETEMVVEGLATAGAAYELSLKFAVDMPITSKIHEVIYEGKAPEIAVKELMTRAAKDEDRE
ncbi:MAG: NAD(P)-dependent glycerol-3-phosphate dehydrogenase [Candidatus Omnitrophica bacterium]|nr:NAD(P)-dependent glycerol-3-phosphate dehydrogenase [Candidatus Omnitrophota bacterium]MDD4012961.1 NAD(P)-dependent glycerol-3-phosphate dehydrogenase [Candidatus Omnitrophota bacterium]